MGRFVRPRRDRDRTHTMASAHGYGDRLPSILVRAPSNLWCPAFGSKTARNAPIDPNEIAKAGIPLGKAGQDQYMPQRALFLVSNPSPFSDAA